MDQTWVVPPEEVHLWRPAADAGEFGGLVDPLIPSEERPHERQDERISTGTSPPPPSREPRNVWVKNPPFQTEHQTAERPPVPSRPFASQLSSFFSVVQQSGEPLF